MNPSYTWQSRVIPLAVIGCCIAGTLFVLWPILETPSWYFANQSYRYPYLLEMFRDQFKAGYWYPRWLPRLAGGYGYPTFVYYPPGFWFIGLPLSLAGIDAVLSCKLVLMLLFIIGGVGIYCLSRCWCDRVPALTCTLLFYLSPYFVTQLYQRGCLSELAAGLVCPWVVLGLVKTAYRIQCERIALGWVVVLAGSLSLTIYMHPQVGLWMGLALIPLSIGASFDSKRILVCLGHYFLAALIAVLLSAPYWFPALNLASSLQFDVTRDPHLFFNLRFPQLFGLKSVHLGPFLPVMAAIGFFLNRRSRIMLAAAGVALFFLWYVTPESLALRHSFEPLYYMQQPVRVLTVFMILQAMGLASFLGSLRPSYRPWLFVAAAILSVISAPLYELRGPLNFEKFKQQQVRSFTTMTHMNEFMPKWANRKGLTPRQSNTAMNVDSNQASFQTSYKSGGSRITLAIDTPRPTSILINQYYFPGWDIRANGKAIPECPRNPNFVDASFCHGKNGLLTIRLPEGSHSVIARYSSPPYQTLYVGMSLLGAFLCLGILSVNWNRVRKSIRRRKL